MPRDARRTSVFSERASTLHQPFPICPCCAYRGGKLSWRISPSARCSDASLLPGAASSAPSGRGSGVLISTSPSSVNASVSPGIFKFEGHTLRHVGS